MATTRTQDQLNDRVAALLKNTVDQLGPELVGNPQLGEVLNRYIDQQVQKAAGAANGKTPPTDGGLTDLIGLSPTAPKDLGDAKYRRVSSTTTIPSSAIGSWRRPISIICTCTSGSACSG